MFMFFNDAVLERRKEMNMIVKRQESILEEVLNQLKVLLGESVYELTIERVVIGVFFTGVKLSNGQGGICATPVKVMPDAVCCSSSTGRMPRAGMLKGRRALEIAEEAIREGDTALKKALSIAILSALSATSWVNDPPQDYVIKRNTDPLDMVFSRDKNVAVVGALGPLLKKLKTGEVSYRVLEMDISTLKPEEIPYFCPPEKAAETLPWADIIVSTGTTLINDSLEELLKAARSDAEFIVVGPSASILPGPLFDRGVSSVGGVLVTDADQLLDILGEAGAGYHFYGRCADKITLYPRKDN